MATTTTLKNATSTSRNTFSDIQKTLATHKVQHIVFVYDPDGTGRILGMEFTIQIEGQSLSFRLPARIQNVECVLYPGRRTLTDAQKACQCDFDKKIRCTI